MPVPRDPLPHTLALVRIATGLLFVLFGQYKVFGSAFVNGFAATIERYINQNQAVGFYKVFLTKVVLPNAELFAYLVAWGELLIGIALVLGLWVRLASLAGAVHMASLMLATWYAPGANAPLWRFFAAQLEHLPLLFLFTIFIAARTSEVWSVEAAWRRRRRKAKSRQE
ncbi:MAG: DoxX family protein [Terriglobia bacterium]